MDNNKIIWDEKSEATVIATLIAHMDYFIHCDFLKPDYFYDIFNKSIYWVLTELYKVGITTVDVLNIENILTSNRGVKYIVEKSGINISDYIQTSKYAAKNSPEEFRLFVTKIIECAYKRELLRATDKIQTECCKDETNIATLENLVNNDMSNLSEEFVVSDDIEMFGDEIDGIWEEITDGYNETGLSGIPSKIPSLNKYLTYEPGELTIVAARMKQGKSAFLMNEAIHKLQSGLSVLYLDTEMNNKIFTERMLANLTGIPVWDIKNGTNLTKADKIKLDDARNWIKKTKFVHKYITDPTANEIVSIHRILKNRINLDFSIYDYIKDDNSKTTSEAYLRLGQITNVLKNSISGAMSIPVLSAVQLNKDMDIADSDRIARLCSSVITWKPKTAEQRRMDSSKCGEYALTVRINRNGDFMDEDDYIDIHFDKKTMRICEAEDHHENREQPFDK